MCVCLNPIDASMGTTFLDQERLALTCRCLGRIPAAYCWTLVVLSMSQMTTKDPCCLLALYSPHPCQGPPSAAQLPTTRHPNILLSETRKRQHQRQRQSVNNVLQGKACIVYGIPPELDSSFCSEASPDGAQRCAQGCTDL